MRCVSDEELGRVQLGAHTVDLRDALLVVKHRSRSNGRLFVGKHVVVGDEENGALKRGRLWACLQAQHKPRAAFCTKRRSIMGFDQRPVGCLDPAHLPLIRVPHVLGNKGPTTSLQCLVLLAMPIFVSVVRASS